MLHEAFKVVNGIDKPSIMKVDITDQEGVSWQEAKKQLRRWYLEQAAALRSVTKQSYFGENQ